MPGDMFVHLVANGCCARGAGCVDVWTLLCVLAHGAGLPPAGRQCVALRALHARDHGLRGNSLMRKLRR